MPEQPAESPRFTRDLLIAAMLFTLAFVVFLWAPIHNVTDSAYSMLASESLVKHHTFTLDPYSLPRNEPKHWVDYVSDGNLYTIELANGHLYYFFPPGNLVLSAPFVAVLNAFGLSAANSDGTYNPEGEQKIESILAALLMAALTVIFFYTSRLVLPLTWSLVLAVGGAFGTQIFSTASRVLWTDTWGTLLLGIALFLILRRELNQGKLNGVILATLLAWSYFARPTYSVHIVAITIYILLYQRKCFLKYAVTGTCWLLLFFLYSWHNFHKLLPSYYSASRLYFGVFWTSLAANTVSPGRGLLVFVPSLFFVGYLLARYRRELAYPRIVLLGLLVIVFHLAVMSCFGHWWGGYSFGPRFSTGLVPWFVVLAILGVQARKIWLEKYSGVVRSVGKKLELSAGAALLFVSIAINTLGAVDRKTDLWNIRPRNIDQFPERTWDWRQPQFLAGFLPPPLPHDFPVSDSMIEIRKSDAEKFLWYGWSPSESEFRWTEENQAAIIFDLNDLSYSQLRIEMMPFLVAGKLTRQRVIVTLNGQGIGTLELKEAAPLESSLSLPANVLRRNNILKFDLPDADSPRAMGLSADQRQLGVAVKWLKLER
jgi:hypothetical protein